MERGSECPRLGQSHGAGLSSLLVRRHRLRPSAGLLLAPADLERRGRAGGAFDRAAEGGDEDGVLAESVGREEVDYVLVIESQSRRAEALRVGAQVETAANQPRFQVGEPIAAIAIRFEYRVQIGQE